MGGFGGPSLGFWASFEKRKTAESWTRQLRDHAKSIRLALGGRWPANLTSPLIRAAQAVGASSAIRLIEKPARQKMISRRRPSNRSSWLALAP